MLDRLLTAGFCLGFAAVLGISWGLIVGVVDVRAGYLVGFILFFLALVVMFRRIYEFEEEAEGDVAPPMEGKVQ